MAAPATFAYIRKPHAFMRETRKPHAFMRETAEPNSKVVSDAVYSEEVTVLEEQGDRFKIQTKVDGYQGWVKRAAVHRTEADFFGQGTIVKVGRVKAHIYGIQDTEFGPLRSLPFESRLKILAEPDDQQKRWIKVGLVDGPEAFIQRGDVRTNAEPLSMQEMIEFSRKFLDIAYTWGGRSSFGFDCSGFMQMLYRLMGVKLPRDAKDQYAWKGFAPVDMEELKPGDLIFFGLAEDKIRHVGMYLGNSQFIHSTVKGLKPYIQISNLKDDDWNGTGTLAFRGARRLKPPAEPALNHTRRTVVLAGALGLALSVILRILKGKAGS